MKKTLVLLASCLIGLSTFNKVEAQYYFLNDDYYYNDFTYELGASIGAMNCMTDLGGKPGVGGKFTKDFIIGTTHSSYGAYFSCTYKGIIGARLEATFGNVSASDQALKGVSPSDIAIARYDRNLSFQSQISEYALIAEFHPLNAFINWRAKDMDPPRISPYLMAGIGYFSFNPQALNKNGDLVDLQPLHTEGQGFAEYPDRKEYSLSQVNFPVGLGVLYEVTPTIKVRAEFVYRFLSTDYLDDVSTNYIDPSVFSNHLNPTDASNAIFLNNRDQGYNIPSLSNINNVPGRKRGDPTNDDSYFTFNLKVGFQLFGERVN